MSDLKAQLEISADASGVEAGVSRAKRSLADLGASATAAGKQAADGIAQAGDGAPKLAFTVDRATKDLARSIERATSAMSSGAKGNREYFESLANQRGANVALLRPFLEQLDQAAIKAKIAADANKKLEESTRFLDSLKGKTDAIGKTASELLELKAAQLGVSDSAAPMIAKLRESEQAANGASKGFGALIGYAKAAVGAFAAYVSVNEVLAKFSTAVDRMDKIDDLSQKLSLSAKTIQEFGYAGKLSGVSLEDMAGSLKKLQVGMLEAATGGKEQAAVFKAMGISVKDAAGNIRATEDVIGDVADVFSGLENGAAKTALAVKLFGKSGSELIPFLNEGRAGIAKLTDEASKLGGVMGDDALKSAANFNDNLDRMKALSEASANAFTSQLIPSINNVMERFIAAAKTTDSFIERLKIASGITVNRALGESYGKQIKDITKEIDDLRAAKNPLADWFSNLDGDIAKLEKVKSTLQELQLMRVLESSNDGYQDQNDRKASGKQGINASALLAALDEDAAKRAKEAADAAAKKYDDLIRRSQDYLVQLQKEADTAGMTAEQKKTYDAMWIAGELQKGGANSKYVTDFLNFAQEQIDASAAIVKAQKEIEESNKRAAEAYKEVQKILKSYGDETRKSIENAQREAEANERLAVTYGMTKSQVEALTLAELENEYANRSALGLTLDRIEALEKLIDAKRRSVAALAQVDAMDAAKKLSDEWKRDFDRIEDWIGDAIGRGVTKGKDIWKSLIDGLKASFARLVLSPIIQPIAAFGASMLNPGAAQAAGGNTFGSTASLLSTGKTIYDGFASGFSGASTVFNSFAGSSVGQSLGLSSTANFVGPVSSTAPATATLTSAGSAISAALPVVAAAVASYFGAKAISNGYKVEGIGNVLNFAGLAGGAVNRLFGMRPRENTTFGIQGNFNQEGFTDAKNFQRWEQKGGTFRSDKDGTDYSDLDAAYAKALGDSFKAVKASTQEFAKTLGLDAAAIQGYAKGLVIDLTGDQAKDAEILAKTFGDLSNEMATTLLPNFKDFQKVGETAGTTLQRLAQTTQVADGVMGLLGRDSNVAFGAVGMAAVGAKQQLIDMAGGVENFASSAAFFSQNFLTQAEQLKPASDKVAGVFKQFGIAGDITKDQFADIVNGIDLTTESGKQMYTALMAISPLFLTIANSAEALAKASSNLDADYAELLGNSKGATTIRRNLALKDADPSLHAQMNRNWDQEDRNARNDRIKTAAGIFNDSLYTGAEKAARESTNVSKTLADLGLSGVKTRDQLRTVIAGIDTTTDAGLKLYESIAKIAPAFGAAADAADALVKQGASLDADYLELIGDTKGARDARRALILQDADPALHGQMNRNWAAEDKKVFEDAAFGLTLQEMRLMGNASGALAAERDRELGLMDPLLHAQKKRIWALQDEQEAYQKALKSVDGAMGVLQRSVEADRKTITTAYEGVMESLGKQIDGVTGSVGKLSNLSSSLRSTVDGMRLESQLGADQASARAQIQTALALAKAGGVFPDADKLQNALSIISQPNEQLYSSFAEFQRNYLKDKNAISELADITDGAKSVQDEMLETLKDQKADAEQGYKDELQRLDDIVTSAQNQISALNGIDTSVKSVSNAIAALNGAILGAVAQRPASTAPAAGPSSSGTQSYIEGLYATIAGKSAGAIDAEGMSFWTGMVNSGVSKEIIEQTFRDAVDNMPKFAVGTNYVPRTMAAIIHEGEAIVPKAYNPAANPALLGSRSNDTQRLERLVEELTAEIEGLKDAVAEGNINTREVADLLDNVTEGGNAMRTEVINAVELA